MLQRFALASSWLMYRLRGLLRAAPLSFPRRVACNICGWRGRRFENDSWHVGVRCPACRSVIRHRLLIASLSLQPEVSWDRLVRGKRVLHFARERSIAWWLGKYAASYVTADLANPRRDINTDLCDMKNVADESWDLLVACDVLEHVADDRAAIREIGRVLAPGGTAILTIPQQDGRKETYQDNTITDPCERERVFGQSDHLRIYGDDFSARLESAGFEVSTITPENFLEPDRRRFVLKPPHPSPHPLATNHRCIFFAKKPVASAARAA